MKPVSNQLALTSSQGLSASKKLVGDTSKALKEKGKGEQLAQLRKVSRDFEAIFTGIMLKSMRDAISKSDLLDAGNSEDIFRSMLDSEYAKIMSEQGSPGLAGVIEKSLKDIMSASKVKNQEAHQAYKRS